jgi:hypothetical protein
LRPGVRSPLKMRQRFQGHIRFQPFFPDPRYLQIGHWGSSNPAFTMPSGSRRAYSLTVSLDLAFSTMLFSPLAFARRKPQRVVSRCPGRVDDPGNLRVWRPSLHSLPPVVHGDQPDRDTPHHLITVMRCARASSEATLGLTRSSPGPAAPRRGQPCGKRSQPSRRRRLARGSPGGRGLLWSCAASGACLASAWHCQRVPPGVVARWPAQAPPSTRAVIRPLVGRHGILTPGTSYIPIFVCGPSKPCCSAQSTSS